MQRFRSLRSLQKFAAVHTSVHNHFYQECHLYSRENFKLNRTAALAEWRQLCASKGAILLSLLRLVRICLTAPTERVSAIKRAYPDVPIRLHLHNTRNTGIANAWAGIEAGVKSLDASLGGVGGCPFAPLATGNIATEDLVYLLERSGVKTNVSLDKAIAAAEWLEEQLGKTVPGMVMKSGGFPRPEAA